MWRHPEPLCAPRMVYWLVDRHRPEQSLQQHTTSRTDSTIERITTAHDFAKVFSLAFRTAELDTIAMKNIVERTGTAIKYYQLQWSLVAHRGGVHNDYRIVFGACADCS